jgi:O-antigen chain-terminating methyltransferase
MIESNNPEIDVNELMKRLHAEVARRRDLGLSHGNGSGDAASTVLPQVSFLAPLPAVASPHRVDVKEERLTGILQRAREKTEVSRRIPKLLRRFFRKQGGYNKLLLESVAVLTKTNVELNQRLQELAGGFEIQNRWLSDLSRARAADAAWMRAAATIIASIPQHRESLLAATNALTEQINALEQKNIAAAEEFHVFRSQTIAASDATREQLRSLARQGEPNVTAESARTLRSEFDRACKHLRNLQAEANGMREVLDCLQQQVATPDNHELDALYVAFENQFRGSRELIKDRVRIYLRDVKKAKIGQTERPILDVGCGRGEWLELLTENGLIAEGVDSNVFMIAECKARGLQVIEGDGVEYLRSLADNSRGAITGFHIIEHLPPRIMVQLFRETFRVLQPGGLAIFETPNPENVLVGSNRFYSDPTHLRPLPKEYTGFVITSVGFTRVEVRPLHPDKNSLPKNGDAPKLRKFINQLFFGEQDYAVIARK